MSLSRADVTLITPEARESALARMGIRKREPLGIGTEAEVYERDAETVVKLYASAERFPHFETLRHLYDKVDSSAVGFALPIIFEVARVGNLVAVVEKRIAGKPLEVLLPGLDGKKTALAEALYLDAVCSLRQIQVRTQPDTYLLFDAAQQSNTAGQSFEHFYAGMLQKKVAQVAPFLSRYDGEFLGKATALADAIRSAPEAPLHLVHGDFFPGNVMVDEGVSKVYGVIDFGSFSLFGNHLIDLAGAIGFYRMYDAERRTIRGDMLAKVLDRIPSDEHTSLFRFLLAHAILTSDMYAPEANPHEDGHFQWAVEILSEAEYWKQAIG